MIKTKNKKETKGNKRKQRGNKKETKRKQKGGMFRIKPKIPMTFFNMLKNEFDNIEQGYINIEIDKENAYVTININNRNSFMFFINDKTLRITQVFKRSNIEISRFIEIIIAVFMRTENFTRLELGDTSKIEFKFDETINISLFKMKILETSQTWYERLGFKNDDIESKREGIVQFINQKIINVIDKSKLTNYGNEIDIDNISVKDFMVFVKQKLKRENAKEIVINIRDIVNELYDSLTTQVGAINLMTNYIQK